MRLYFILLILLISSCKSNRILRHHWQLPAADLIGQTPEQLSFDWHNHAIWVAGRDSIHYRYDLLRDTLRLQAPNGFIRLFIIDLNCNNRQLCLTPLQEKAVYPCLYRGKKVKKNSCLYKAAPYSGREKTWQELLPALYSPTVELRLKNLLLLFEEGDYITTHTIEKLTVIPPERAQINDLEAFEAQKAIVKQIRRITRRGNQFVATLINGSIHSSMPIYEQVEQRRELKGMFDIHIETGANASLQSGPKAIKINIEGVKIGKGWLMLGLPSMQIKGNWGSMLGFKFYIAR